VNEFDLEHHVALDSLKYLILVLVVWHTFSDFQIVQTTASSHVILTSFFTRSIYIGRVESEFLESGDHRWWHSVSAGI